MTRHSLGGVYSHLSNHMNPLNELGSLSLNNKLKRAIWNITYALFFRPLPTKVFWPWRRLVLRIFGANIDIKAHVYCSAKIWAPWNLKMESGACLGPDTICYNQAMVELKENVTVSQYSYLCTAGHRTDSYNTANTGLIVSPITIHKNAWIGTRSFIGMGVEIGEAAIVGATASVYKDVDAYTIVGGNPAKFIKNREVKEE